VESRGGGCAFIRSLKSFALWRLSSLLAKNVTGTAYTMALTFSNENQDGSVAGMMAMLRMVGFFAATLGWEAQAQRTAEARIVSSIRAAARGRFMLVLAIASGSAISTPCFLFAISWT
jgi:hypothetical protein